MYNESKVSIIMSVYNESPIMLKEAIESILNQTYQNYEFIIVLDNPENEIAKNTIYRFKKEDSRIVIFENKVNMGLAVSLNKAMDLSTGDFIARMDADDISFPNRIDRQVQYLERNPNIDLIGTDMNFIDENGENIKTHNKLIIQEKLINSLIKYSNMFYHPTWMFRKKILENLRGYREFPSGQDYDFILRAKYYKYNLRNLDEVLLKYRIRSNSISVSKNILQRKMTLYIQKLYSQRVKSGEDLFDIKYIRDIYSNKEYIKLRKADKMYFYAKTLWRNKKYSTSFIYFIGSFFRSKDQCNIFYNRLVYKVLVKFYK